MFKRDLQETNWKEAFTPAVYQRALNYLQEQKVLDCKTIWIDNHQVKLVSLDKGSYDNNHITQITIQRKVLCIYATQALGLLFSKNILDDLKPILENVYKDFNRKTTSIFLLVL